MTIRFASANYVADVWLNGTWIGYHEGGATPFAIQAGESLRPGAENVLAVRVHTIPRGTRHDVVPWGATDWWNYGGLTGSVWLEAAPAIHVARADVVPHLDAVEVEVLISQAAELGGLAPPDADAPAGIPAGSPPCCGRRSTPPASIRTTCSIPILVGSSPTSPTRCSSSRRRSRSRAPAW